jgi:hypothetical protein
MDDNEPGLKLHIATDCQAYKPLTRVAMLHMYLDRDKTPVLTARQQRDWIREQKSGDLDLLQYQLHGLNTRKRTNLLEVA